MENEIFKAGVLPGGPTSHNEIKMLVCYVLSRLEGQMSFSHLHEALAEGGLVNYFELVQAVDGLIKTGHIAVEKQLDAERKDMESERYEITDVGRQAAEAFESTLPLSVREKAVKAAERLLRRRRREAEVIINVSKMERGYLMELSIPEMGDNLVAFSIFLPTFEECETVRRRFLNDPVFIYKGVLALLTGDRDVLGRIFPTERALYD